MLDKLRRWGCRQSAAGTQATVAAAPGAGVAGHVELDPAVLGIGLYAARGTLYGAQPQEGGDAGDF